MGKQGARDAGQTGHHVDLGPQTLETLLLGDAEALFLVDNHESQTLEADIL